MTSSRTRQDRLDSSLQGSYISLLLQKVLKTEAFVYPFHGVLYFVEHRVYWPTFAQLFIPMAVIYVIIFQALFVTIFPVYAFVATLLLGPIGIVQAFIFLFQITGKLSNLVLKITFFSKLQAKTFDQVLIDNDYATLVELFEKTQSAESESPWAAMKVWVQTKAWPSFLRGIVHAMIFLIPFSGPFLVLYIKGRSKSAKVHDRYHQLAKLSKSEREVYCKVFRKDYTAFGHVAMFLESIPLFSFFFLFTNNMGMALWTADNKEKFSVLDEAISGETLQ